MRKRKGFTMVELMVVVIIMAILGLAVMPSLVGSSEKAKYSRAWTDLNAISNAFTAFYGNRGTLPKIKAGDLSGVFENSDDKDLLQSFLGTPLANLKDPWNAEYKVAGDWGATEGKGCIIVYVGGGSGTASFGTDSDPTDVRVDPYNDDTPMAKLIINVK